MATEIALVVVSILAAGLALLLYLSERKRERAEDDANDLAAETAEAVVDADEAIAGTVYADPGKSGRLIDEVKKRFGGPEK